MAQVYISTAQTLTENKKNKKRRRSASFFLTKPKDRANALSFFVLFYNASSGHFFGLGKSEKFDNCGRNITKLSTLAEFALFTYNGEGYGIGGVSGEG